jgi:hypothetical protein
MKKIFFIFVSRDKILNKISLSRVRNNLKPKDTFPKMEDTFIFGGQKSPS